MTKKELLAVPKREEWDAPVNGVYGVYLIPTAKKHESGYSCMRLVEEANPWHTGTPTEERCFYALQCKNRIHPEPYYGVVVEGKFSAINYDGDLMPLPPDLVAWQKITPFEANPSEEGREE